ncbi:MAG: polyprenyl synthetase family protein [Armatimonadetes bacterium]|nr:polyprenyl synthetase family protein [Armatimonadota bacterium]
MGTKPSPQVDLTQIYAPVQADLAALPEMLRDELRADDSFIGELVAHVLSTRGKLVRPALVFLSAQACRAEIAAPPPGAKDEEMLVAAAVELIHVASLIHDDVIDQADLRRGSATVNTRWGNQVAVLLGDYLFAKSFHLLSRISHPEVAPGIAMATVRMSQAEIKQIKYGGTPHTQEQIYLDIIDGKTAWLFSAACRCGALVVGASEARAAALADFGLNWGMAFQIVDDALDVTSSTQALGKPIGSDINTGKITLPTIIALKRSAPADRERLERLLTSPDGGLDEVREIIARCDGVGEALRTAEAYTARAAAALTALNASPARTGLLDLTTFVLQRQH